MLVKVPIPSVWICFPTNAGLWIFFAWINPYTTENQCWFNFFKKQTKKINHLIETYKYVEEPEDSFVGQYMQNIPRLRIDDWKPVDFVFQ